MCIKSRILITFLLFMCFILFFKTVPFAPFSIKQVKQLTGYSGVSRRYKNKEGAAKRVTSSPYYSFNHLRVSEREIFFYRILGLNSPQKTIITDFVLFRSIYSVLTKSPGFFIRTKFV